MQHPIELRRRALEQTAEVKRAAMGVLHAATVSSRLAPAGAGVVLLTSAMQGEGKTLTAAALAMSAAQVGHGRILLMDLNWYRPMLHQALGLERRHGLPAVLDGEFSQLVQPVGSTRLDLVTAPLDPGAVGGISGEAAVAVIRRLISQARAQYELVILDAAALFPTNRSMMDPVLLSTLADGVVLVVRMQFTPRQQVKRAQQALLTAGARVMGIIANQRWRNGIS